AAGLCTTPTTRSTAIRAFIATRISIPLRWRNRTRFICRLSWWPVRWTGSRLTRRWNTCWTIPAKPGFFKISPRRRHFFYAMVSPPRIWSIFILWRCQKMKNKGCAFEIQGGGTSRYFTSPLVHGFSDFVRFLDENRGEAGHAPLPLHKRIPQATQISEAEWRNIADNQDTGYSCFIVVNIAEN